MSTPEDLNASFTADQWLTQDLRHAFGHAGLDEGLADWAVRVLSDFGLGQDYVLACAAEDLEQL